MNAIRGSPVLGERIAVVRRDIEVACERAGRDPREVTLIGVSKTHPVHVLAEAAEVGLTDFGESRAQELVAKSVDASVWGLQVRWHFIGRLQRNKVRAVLPRIATLHSLDSERLIEAIARAAEEKDSRSADDPLPCYLQVNLTGEASKGGVEPPALPRLLSAASRCAYLEVVGLMTVAPLAADPEASRSTFRALRELAEANGLGGLSMGMSNDYPVAVEEGATAVRVGRAIFGERQDG